MANGLALAATRASRAIRTGAGCCCFTNIFTGTPAAALARSTKPAGRPWSRDCWKTWAETVDSGLCRQDAGSTLAARFHLGKVHGPNVHRLFPSWEGSGVGWFPDSETLRFREHAGGN